MPAVVCPQKQRPFWRLSHKKEGFTMMSPNSARSRRFSNRARFMPSRANELFLMWSDGTPLIDIFNAILVPSETKELMSRTAVAEIAREEPPAPTTECSDSPFFWCSCMILRAWSAIFLSSPLVNMIASSSFRLSASGSASSATSAACSGLPTNLRTGGCGSPSTSLRSKSVSFV